MALLGDPGGASRQYVFIPALLAVDKTAISIWLTNFRVSPQTLTLAFFVSVGVGILAGFAPAIQSSRVKIVDGLRQVV
jgi:ABC-type antimicrobial peptide transport system permease subunit